MSSEKLFRKGGRETNVISFTVERKGEPSFSPKTARSSRKKQWLETFFFALKFS